MMRPVQVLLLFSILLLSFHQQPTAAQPLISVRKLTATTDEGVVEGQKVQYDYEIRNLGNATARGVLLKEEANLSGLKVVEGGPTMTIGNVEPHDTVKKARMVVIPPTERVIPASRAKVVYSYEGENGEEMTQEGYSSASTPILVYTRASYRTVNKDYTQEWILFTLAAAVFLLLPFSVWQKQKQASAAVSQSIKKKKAA